jgi:hypothetical protein
MDILNFREKTAEETIAFAQGVIPNTPENDGSDWSELFSFYIQNFVPKLRELAQGGQASPSTDSAVA